MSPADPQPLLDLLCADRDRMSCLAAVAELPVEGAWIGAGFVRSLVWDAACGIRTELDDVDVIWFDREAGRAQEQSLDDALWAAAPGVHWSVHNQARMHEHNGDPPYRDLHHALRCWPETATAVAVRLAPDLQVLAPFGLDDLFGLRVRPTPHMRSRPDRRAAYAARCTGKRWAERWPGVQVEPLAP